MLSYLHLSNFKSFSDISIDLRKSRGAPKKMALIYGENGSGKSNLVLSLLFLLNTFNTHDTQERLNELAQPVESMEKELNSEDRDSETQNTSRILSQILRASLPTLGRMLKDCKKFETNGPLSLRLGFSLNGHDGSYFVEFDENGPTKEELRYLVSAREGSYFSISRDRVDLSRTIFKDTKYRAELIEKIEKFWGKHTFLSIIMNDCKRYNNSYMKEKFAENFFVVLRWLIAMNIHYKGPRGDSRAGMVASSMRMKIKEGFVENKEDKELKAIERALNTFFSSLYSDIKSVCYEFSPARDGKFKYELHFKKCISDKILSIPLSLESSGTQRLVELFPAFIEAVRGSLVIVDEVDNGIHDILMRKIVESLNDSLAGQLIMTTHNTYLLNEATPDEAYIIRVDACGNKVIDCIADYEPRTQKNHNMQKKYLRGDYYGIPFTRSFDFTEMVAGIASHLEPKAWADGD